MYIYFLQNLNNTKGYVGQTIQPLSKYINKVFSRALKGDTGKPALYNAIRFHGKHAFKLYVLAETDSKDELNELEIKWIKLLRTCEKNFGYNRSKGGAGCRIKWTEEQRHAQSLRQQGRKGTPHTEETKRHLSEIRLGKPLSIETRKAQSLGKTGKKWGTERRQAHSKLFRNLVQQGYITPPFKRKYKKEENDCQQTL